MLIVVSRFPQRNVSRVAFVHRHPYHALVRLTFSSALDHLGATMFYCKIGDDNKASRGLFERCGVEHLSFNHSSIMRSPYCTEECCPALCLDCVWHAIVLRLGFSPHAYVKAFKETELRFETAAGGGADRVRAQTAHVETVGCLPLSAEGLN